MKSRLSRHYLRNEYLTAHFDAIAAKHNSPDFYEVYDFHGVLFASKTHFPSSTLETIEFGSLLDLLKSICFWSTANLDKWDEEPRWIDPRAKFMQTKIFIGPFARHNSVH